MKKIIIAFLTTVLFFFASCNTTETHSENSITMLYPTEATATKYGQTIEIPDLSGLPLFIATYEANTNKVIVRKGDRKLTLIQSGVNNYYKSGQYSNLNYSMDAVVDDGKVSKITYTETEDDITVRIIYIPI